MTGIQGLRPIDQARKNEPGTIDFMRTKIKHVVYYMIENCSFDHVCGWLYEKGEEGINFVRPRCELTSKAPSTLRIWAVTTISTPMTPTRRATPRRCTWKSSSIQAATWSSYPLTHITT